jgi:rhamnosyl/mannosyltransferase
MKSVIRVCHIGKYYPPECGGMETHLQTLARAQAELGMEVSVVCVNHSNRAGQLSKLTPGVEDADGAVRVIRVGRYGTLARMDFSPGLLREVFRLRHDLPDVVHLHTPNPAPLLVLALARLSTTLVITHHSDVVRQRFLRYPLVPFERFVYRRAARILTTSPRYADGSPLLRRYLDKVESLPLGLDLTPFANPSAAAAEFATKLQERYGSPLWLAVGRLVYYKGLDVALAALPKVPGTLLVIGQGPWEARLREQAERAGVAGRVVWWGQAPSDELVGAYHAATALWFPSTARSEGFGQVQVEAMASGCPVINTDILHSGVPWVSRHEESGLTVPLNEPAALAAASWRLLEEPGLRDRLAANARARAGREFGDRTMALRSREIYQDAMPKDDLHALNGFHSFVPVARSSS